MINCIQHYLPTCLVVCNRHNEVESCCFACQKSHRQLWSYYSTFIYCISATILLSLTPILSQQDLRLRRRRVLDALDRTHFQWLVVFVAGVGFLADGYDVFSPTIAPKPSAITNSFLSCDRSTQPPSRSPWSTTYTGTITCPPTYKHH